MAEGFSVPEQMILLMSLHQIDDSLFVPQCYCFGLGFAVLVDKLTLAMDKGYLQQQECTVLAHLHFEFDFHVWQRTSERCTKIFSNKEISCKQNAQVYK